MAYAESESMALKRLRVALKRKDWQMFDYGLSRIVDLINSGTQITEIQEWYKIFDITKTEKVPEDLTQKLSKILESMVTPGPVIQRTASDSAAPSVATTKFTPPKMPPLAKGKAADISFIVYMDSTITSEQASTIQKIRYNLDNIAINQDLPIDNKLLSEMSKLIKSLDKTYQEYNGLETLLSNHPEPGIIITTSPDSEIINILNKFNIDFSIEDVKKPSSNKYWKIYPLGGLTSIYYCPVCNTRTFYNNSTNTVVATCKKCSSAAYPDLYPIFSSNPLANPKLWYMAYEALTISENWLLISPPNINEKPTIAQLLSEACKHAIINNAYIVSNKSEVGTWWRNKLEETISNCNVAPVCFNVEILLNNYIKIPEAKAKQ